MQVEVAERCCDVCGAFMSVKDAVFECPNCYEQKNMTTSPLVTLGGAGIGSFGLLGSDTYRIRSQLLRYPLELMPPCVVCKKNNIICPYARKVGTSPIMVSCRNCASLYKVEWQMAKI